MKYAYFPGCSLSATGIEFDMSTKEIAKLLDIELWEIPDWNCCGASSAHLTDHLLSLALPARNMAIAEAEGLDVAIPCAACYQKSKAVEIAVKESEEMKNTISEVIERKYEGKSEARCLLDVMANDIDAEKISAVVTKPLKDLKVACYYGCLLVRPPKTGFDDPEDPQSMDKLMELVGATPVDWAFKTECCGASHLATKTDIGLELLDRIYAGAKDAGADCIVNACPMCMNNLDMRQTQVEAKLGKKYNLPVYYFTELMGLAMGVNSKNLGLDKHFVEAEQLAKKVLDAAGRRDTA